jgi:hypothetical protein
MTVGLAKGFAVAFAALGAAAMLHPASARDDYGFRDIMVEEGGKKPVKRQKAIEPKKDTEPKRRPRGSSYIPSTGLPRTEPVVVAPASPGVYKPPPINSFSDRVINCNHSFPLNAGIGNNPTDRSSYVRQCAN